MGKIVKANSVPVLVDNNGKSPIEWNHSDRERKSRGQGNDSLTSRLGLVAVRIEGWVAQKVITSNSQSFSLFSYRPFLWLGGSCYLTRRWILLCASLRCGN